MRKKIILICIVLLLLVGCKKVDNNDNYAELILNSLNDNQITNNVSLGYKYYLPKGVKKIQDYDYNQVFLVENNYIYLYVDIISYFYKKKLIQNNNENDYYNQKVQYREKRG